MTVIVQAGQYNINAVNTPGVVVQIIPPNQLLAGVPTNTILMVGTASWGPVNSATLIGGGGQAVSLFGAPNTRTYDLVTGIIAASQQGANTFYGVRVTDGTDESAFTDVLDTTASTPLVGMILTALYTGVVGNTIQATISNGSQYQSYKITIALPNVAAEVFDNITGSGAAFWQNMVNAINMGQSSARPPSQIVVASLPTFITTVVITTPGSYTTAPTFSTSGSGTGADLTPTLYALSATPSVTGTGYAPGDTQTLTGGTHSTVATLTTLTTKLVSFDVNASQSGSGSYAPNDTVTLAGGTFSSAAVLTVTHTQVASATVASGGSGGTPGTQTVTGTTGTGTKFQASVTVSGGGAITAVLSITVAGDYTANPTLLTAEPVTGAGLSGATLSIKMGVLTATISTAGSYTVNSATFTQSATSGAGTGATFNTGLFGVNTVSVNVSGSYTTLPSNPVASTSSGAGTGATFTMAWGLLGAIVNDGGSGFNSSSQLVISGSGGGAGTLQLGSITTPALDAYTLAGGTDGVDDITGETLIGNDDTTPRTGMYAGRNTNCSVGVLVDNDDSTTWLDQVNFGLGEGMYMVVVDVPGNTLQQTATAKNTAGIDSYAAKIMVGNWIYWYDPFNTVLRVISPQSFVAGRLAVNSPQYSSLNDQLFGIVATQLSYNNQRRSSAEVNFMQLNGLDDIVNPAPGIPGANYFATCTGQNTSSIYLANDDNYTRVTNFLALTIANGVGNFIGLPNSSKNALAAKNTISSFLQALKPPNLPDPVIQNFSVTINSSPNPYTLYLSVRVETLFTIRVFLVDLQTGLVTLQSVTPVQSA